MTFDITKVSKILKDCYSQPLPTPEEIEADRVEFVKMLAVENAERDRDPVAYDRLTEGMLPRLPRC